MTKRISAFETSLGTLRKFRNWRDVGQQDPENHPELNDTTLCYVEDDGCVIFLDADGTACLLNCPHNDCLPLSEWLDFLVANSPFPNTIVETLPDGAVRIDGEVLPNM